MSKICIDINEEEFTEISAALLKFEGDVKAVEKSLDEYVLNEMRDYFAHRTLTLERLRVKLYEAWAKREGG